MTNKSTRTSKEAPKAPKAPKAPTLAASLLGKKAETPKLSKKERRAILMAKRRAASETLGMVTAPLSYFRPVFALDQALDDTGWSCVIPNVEARCADRVSAFAAEALAMTNPDIEGSKFMTSELKETFKSAISEVLSGGAQLRQIITPPFGGARLGTSAGVVFKQGTGVVVLVHGTISSHGRDDAEWRRIQSKARTIGMVIAKLRLLMIFTMETRSLHVTYEGVALGGSPLTTKNLPMLGLVAGRLIEGLVEEGGTSPEDLREMPISSWKLAFAGHSHADKTMVKERLENILGIVFARHDEDNAIDATAMALLESASNKGFGKATCGRILPQPKRKKNT